MGGPIEKTEAALLGDLLARVRALERRAAINGRAAFPGEVRMWLGAVAPSGWAILDGSTFDEDEHPGLYEILGTNVLPDWRGYMPVGLKPSDSSFDTLGEKGGAKTHTLNTNEIPAHTHDFPDASYTLLWGSAGNVHFDNVQAIAGPASGNGIFTQQNAWNKTTSSGGAGGAHNNMPPYVVVNFIVKL